jgi:hypothetical protein
LIEQPARTLNQLLAAGHQEKAKALAAVAREFVRRFAEKNGVRIELSDGAVSCLIAQAEKERIHMRDLCAKLFRDYEFGLKLLRKNDEVLVITEEAIEDPDKFLSEWLVRTYRGV